MKVIGLNPGHLLKSFVLFKEDDSWTLFSSELALLSWYKKWKSYLWKTQMNVPTEMISPHRDSAQYNTCLLNVSSEWRNFCLCQFG